MGFSQRPRYYRLGQGNRPEPISWYEAGVLLADYRGRCIAYHKLKNGIKISTAFLVFDHGLLTQGPPVLWNTIVTFPSGNERMYQQYSTHCDALDGHDEAVAVVNLMGDSEDW
jgi:hypothetical protein